MLREFDQVEESKVEVTKTKKTTKKKRRQKKKTIRQRRKRSANKNEEHVFPRIDAIRAFV